MAIRSIVPRRLKGERGAQLRALLAQQMKEASEEALSAGGQVSSEQMARLERLSRLIELAEAHTPMRRSRWLVAVLLGATLLVVSILLFVRTAETEIELDLAVEGVEFLLSDRQALTDVIGLSAFGVSGLNSIQLPSIEATDSSADRVISGGSSAIRIAAMAGDRPGTVTLAPLVLSGRSRLRIQGAGVPNAYRFSIEGADLALQVGLHGPVQIGVVGSPPFSRDFATPRSILMRASSGVVDIDLFTKPESPTLLLPQIESAELSFFRIDELPDSAQTLVRRISTIQSGTLYLEELNGKAVQLRPGEALHFSAVHGEIRMLELLKDHIAIKFRGKARGMGAGWGGANRSYMPTYLEWLSARHGLFLLWGSTLYIFGILMAIFRWWGVRL